MSKQTAKTLYIIDGHAQIFRAFHAIQGLTAPDGRPTNAIFGFTRMLLHLVREHHPDLLITAFDSTKKTFRHDLYPDYKATRKPTPPELIAQVPSIQDIVRAYRIPIAMADNFEADDVIGTLARQATEQGYETVIVSADKDLKQLLNEHVTMYDPAKNRFHTAASFEEEKGIPPKQLPELMGLWGDSSDNIPGVEGIGEKTGLQLILQYGSLDAILAHAGEIKGKRGERLREQADRAKLSEQLATINTDAPVVFNPQDAIRHEPDLEALHALFHDLGFAALLKELDHDAETPATDRARKYQLVNTPELFAAFLQALQHQPLVAIDTETTNQDPMLAELVGISVSWANDSGYYLPFQAPEGEPTLGQDALDALTPLLEHDEIQKVGQNIKYDALVLRRAGIHLRGIVFDTLIASQLLDGHIRGHDLDSLAQRHLGITKVPTKHLIGTGKKQISMNEVEITTICDYACEDADCTWQLQDCLKERLNDREQTLLESIEMPLSAVLTKMQFTGIRVDAMVLEKQNTGITRTLDAIEQQIYEFAGGEFNINSPKQLGEVLFDRLGLTPVRKTKTGPSTDEATLQVLRNEHELPDRLLEYRFYSKLKSTYLDALPKMIHPETRRIHTTLSQTSTATGRLASSNPNLQNIPARTQQGRAIRAAFVPREGWTLIAADYSQVELRMLAHFSEDTVLQSAFESNRDIHRVVAAEVNGVSLDEVTDEMRSSAKAINFGILYGQSAHGLSQTTGMNRAEAQAYIDKYFHRLPRVRQWIDQVIADAHDKGFVETMHGRRRILAELASSNKARAAAAEREAVNTIIQGSAAELIKLAMINLERRMREDAPLSRMILQVHDELLFESPPEETEELTRMIRDEMEQALSLRVPLRVDLGTGPNWMEAK